MIYTIEEIDRERQHLLGQILTPVSLDALINISLPKQAKILDIGCGLGDTTLMLRKLFPDAVITGLDADAALIDIAIEEKKSAHHNLDFICGDAMHLPFADNSFDFVFTRYCLVHLPSAMDGLQEMKRVCKPAGIVFAQEPDIHSIISYPESWAYQQLKVYLNLLFADALLGRKLISYFRQLRLQGITHHIKVLLGDEQNLLKQLPALTGAAIGKALIQKKLATAEEHAALVSELERARDNLDIVIIMAPSIAVWGTKTSTLNYIYQHEK